MEKNMVSTVVREVLPEHTISVVPGGWFVVSEWNWIKGKPKSFGNFYGLDIRLNDKFYEAKLRLINIPHNYIPLALATFALLQIGWGDWLRMPIALIGLYSVVGWHFRKELLFYQAKSKEILARLNS